MREKAVVLTGYACWSRPEKHVIDSASHFHDKVGLDAGFRFNVL